jgi:transforming growth factor-beta-induced protein
MRNNEFFKVIGSFLLIAIFAFGAVSCNDDDDMEPMESLDSIVDIVTTNPNFSLLNAALSRTGLDAALATGTFTVFAPNNAAFNAIGISSTSDFDSFSTDELTAILGYHVVAGRLEASQLSSGELETISGESITIATGSGVSVNGVPVITADVEASDGIIHIIGQVLLPPTEDPGTIVDIAVGNEDFSLLVAALTRANLVGALTAEGPFTVFAPNNAAFNAAGFNSASDFEALIVEDLTAILTYHVVSGRLLAADLVAGPVPTLNGEDLTISLEGGATVNGVNIIATDIEGSNGVIHVVEDVLMPPAEENPNLVEAAQAAGLTTLLDAVTAAGLGETLLGLEDITVFAPTNAAFTSLINSLDGVNGLADLVEFLGGVEGLQNVLQYHVLPTAIFAEGVPTTPTEVETLNGETITVVRNGAVVTITDANGNEFEVVAGDVAIENGVVHVIDGVLLPELPEEESNSIVDIAVGNPDFSLLVAAVIKVSEETSTDVLGLLSGEGDFTVFAPNNDAFIAAGFANEAAINAADANTLLSILTYHVLPVKALAADVPAASNTPLASLGGEIYATRQNGAVFINGIPVIAADIEADNGVIHAIGSVLIPPAGNIVETAVANENFSYLAAAVVRASTGSEDLVAVLSSEGPFTVFAPTNDAFIAGGFETIEDINNADPEVLIPILKYHVLAGRVFSSDLAEGITPATVQGQNVSISLSGGATVTGAGNDTASNIIITNVVTSNGVIHAIDRVLLPVTGDE